MTVVSLHGGQTVELANATPKEVIDILHEATTTISGETHTAIALVLVDKQGRLLTREWWMLGSGYELLAGLEILKHKMLKDITADDA